MAAVVNDKFHGMKIISDRDCLSVRGHNVIELSSSNHLICRYYDNNGLEEDDPFEIDTFSFCIDPNEKNIIESIKHQVGTTELLISENAIDFIKQFASV